MLFQHTAEPADWDKKCLQLSLVQEWAGQMSRPFLRNVQRTCIDLMTAGSPDLRGTPFGKWPLGGWTEIIHPPAQTHQAHKRAHSDVMGLVVGKQHHGMTIIYQPSFISCLVVNLWETKKRVIHSLVLLFNQNGRERKKVSAYTQIL